MSDNRKPSAVEVSDEEIRAFWREAPSRVGYEATRFALQEFLKGRAVSAGRGTPDAAVDRAVKLWDTVRPFVLTGNWSGMRSDEAQAIDRFILAMDDLLPVEEQAPQDVPLVVPPSKNEGAPDGQNPAAIPADAGRRIGRAVFAECALCKAMYGEPAVCRGHDEAEALGLLTLDRLLLHNAGVHALYSRARAVHSEQARQGISGTAPRDER